jgi:peroxiredoxin
MKTTFCLAFSLLSFLSLGQPCPAAEPSSAISELGALMTKVGGKLDEGKKSPADLEGELKEFDALIAKHKGEKSDDVAQIHFMKALIYAQVLKETEKGNELIAQVAKEFPDSKAAASIKRGEEAKKQSEEANKTRSALVVGSKFPDFDEKDLAGKPLSIANYKGKVVLIDFWATWCGPCVAELPNVMKAYEKHHEKGFEIIGISLDSDKAKLEKFTKEKNMPWQQFFDGGGWKNKLATKYGINSIPATYLLDGEGKIIGTNLRGEALEAAVAKALGKS